MVTSGQTYTAIVCCPQSLPPGALVLAAQRVAPRAQCTFTLEQRLHLRASEEGCLARIRRQVLGEAGSHLRPLSLPLVTLCTPFLDSTPYGSKAPPPSLLSDLPEGTCSVSVTYLLSPTHHQRGSTELQRAQRRKCGKGWHRRGRGSRKRGY